MKHRPILLRDVCLLASLSFLAFAPTESRAADSAVLKSYDCDAPVDAYQAFSEATMLPTTVNGTISVLKMASKDYAPSVSVTVINADQTVGAGFQITASSDDATTLEVALISRDGTNDVEVAKGHVLASAAISFTLSAAASGKIAMMVNGIPLKTSIKPQSSQNIAVTCTSGHFRVMSMSARPDAPMHATI